jgi:hypothetical protein
MAAVRVIVTLTTTHIRSALLNGPGRLSARNFVLYLSERYCPRDYGNLRLAELRLGLNMSAMR